MSHQQRKCFLNLFLIFNQIFKLHNIRVLKFHEEETRFCKYPRLPAGDAKLQHSNTTAGFTEVAVLFFHIGTVLMNMQNEYTHRDTHKEIYINKKHI